VAFQGFNEKDLPSRKGVAAAANRLSGIVTLTPLLPVPGAEGRVWIKAESLQRGGAFKFRGAYNRLVQIPAAERHRGVVAFSSGNHAQGVARAAGLLGMTATIVMPADAPKVKLDNTAALGAEIVLYDRHAESREVIAAGIASERGAPLVPSFDDVDVIEGQGSAGLEIAGQLGGAPTPAWSRRAAAAGLPRGSRSRCPIAEIIVVEPEGWDDMGRSPDAGEIVEVPARCARHRLRCAADAARRR
jgi:threonine dehydratase